MAAAERQIPDDLADALEYQRCVIQRAWQLYDALLCASPPFSGLGQRQQLN